MGRRPKNVISLEAFERKLKDNDMRVTGQRIAVHKAMTALGHATADMVMKKIAESGTTGITTASVYNILSQISALGIYSKRLNRNGKLIFDSNPSRHLHVYDPVLDVYQDIEDDTLYSEMAAKIRGRRFRGFKIDELDISIICKSTKKPRIRR